jgi:hypothetical protein
MLITEAIKDLDYTFRPLNSGPRKCERPGSEEPEQPVEPTHGPGMTRREQGKLDANIRRIDAVHNHSAAPVGKRTKIQNSDVVGQKRTGHVSERNEEVNEEEEEEVRCKIESEAAPPRGDIRWKLRGSTEEVRCKIESEAAPPRGDIRWKMPGPREEMDDKTQAATATSPRGDIEWKI